MTPSTADIGAVGQAWAQQTLAAAGIVSAVPAVDRHGVDLVAWFVDGVGFRAVPLPTQDQLRPEGADLPRQVRRLAGDALRPSLPAARRGLSSASAFPSINALMRRPCLHQRHDGYYHPQFRMAPKPHVRMTALSLAPPMFPQPATRATDGSCSTSLDPKRAWELHLR